MSKKQREFLAGKIYHLIQRGHNRMYLFNDQTDKAAFMEIMKSTLAKYSFELLFYVLMDNHYHLIVELQDAPIEKAMHRINLSYCKYYNKKYDCSGTIYGQRYMAYRVADQRYLKQLILYIANNPVKAGIVKRPYEYRWSAHMELSSPRTGIVSAHRLFELIGGNAEQGMKTYDRLIRRSGDAVSQTTTDQAFDAERRMENLAVLFEKMLGKSNGGTTTENGRSTTGKRIRAGGRDQLSVQFRRQFVSLAMANGFKTAEIAQLLHVTIRCVCNYRKSSDEHQLSTSANVPQNQSQPKTTPNNDSQQPQPSSSAIIAALITSHSHQP